MKLSRRNFFLGLGSVLIVGPTSLLSDKPKIYKSFKLKKYNVETEFARIFSDELFDAINNEIIDKITTQNELVI